MGAPRCLAQGTLAATRHVLYAVILLAAHPEHALFALYFRQGDINVHHDANISGVKHMQIGQHFSAGRGLWMQTIASYGEGEHEQHFTPRFIIGDNVSLSEYVHIGCVNHVEIGNNVLMGSKIYITDHNHGVYRGEHPDSPAVRPAKRP